MKKPSLTAPVTEPSISSTPGYFIGIDYHKRYSVYCVLDAAGRIEARGRIEHAVPADFAALVEKWPGRAVF